MKGDSYEEDRVPYSGFPAAVRSDPGAADRGREEGFLDAGHDAGDDEAKQGNGESMHGMGGMSGMMGMMKMMEQCSAMMESSHSSKETKESQR